MDRFKTDEEIINYIRFSIGKLSTFEENRLYKEEQLQISDDVLKIRNCIEWVIRINKIIKSIKFALKNSIDFAEKMTSPLEDSENKDMYSYYLEDSVYRVVVLWDMYRQLLNEFYKFGYDKVENIGIFKFLKELKKKNLWDISNIDKITNYLNTDGHKFVREYLRNTFTHSVESTTSYIFHSKNAKGFIKPEIEYILPRHPYENIVNVIDDVLQLAIFINDVIDDIGKFVENNIMIVEVNVIFNCGRERPAQQENIKLLKENAEKILCFCDKDCKQNCIDVIAYDGENVCKPKAIKYNRIYSEVEDSEGIIEIKYSFDDIKKEQG